MRVLLLQIQEVFMFYFCELYHEIIKKPSEVSNSVGLFSIIPLMQVGSYKLRNNIDIIYIKS